MRVLVTGATGFIGGRLVDRLVRQGHEVVALVRRRTPELEHPKIRVELGALSDPALLARACQGCDAVVHLAIASGVSDPAIVRAVNVDATRLLLDAARTAGVRRFIFTSTISATRARMGPYGATKREGEQLVAASGIPFVTLRPSLVYGPGGLGLFATLTAYLRGLPVVPVIGNGEIELDPIHVDDVCAVIERSLTADHVLGHAYDLLGPERVTFNQFLAMLSREIGVKKPVVHIPGPVAMVMAWGLSLVSKRPPVTMDNVIGMVYPARVDRSTTARDFDVPWTRLSDGLSSLVESLNAGPRFAAAEPVAIAARADLPAIPLLAAAGPSRPVRVGIVGLGKMGLVHSAILSNMPDVTLAGLCDLQPVLVKSLRGMGFAAPYYAALGDMLAQARLDAVWVCTPPDSHVAIARVCAAAGVAVMIEKPLAHTLDSARELRDLMQTARAPLACGYAQAFIPVFAAAHAAVASGALGSLRQCTSSMYLSQVFGPQKGWIADPARSGGGVVANISSHTLFLLWWMFGSPLAARATMKRLYGAVEDELHGVFEMPGGAEVAFDTSWSVPDYPISFTSIEITGDNGTLRATNETLELNLQSARGGWASGATRVRQSELTQSARFDLNGEFFYQENAHFLAWVTGGAEPPITARAGYEVQRMMDALYRSAQADGRRVELAP